MKDINKLKEFFLSRRAATTVYESVKENKEKNPLDTQISDLLKYNSFEEVKKIVAKALRDALIEKEKGINEAKKEDAIDTITMDVPLFIRMLEYAREDASQDVDLHDVTEKIIALSKEVNVLQMEDYDEIIGAAEDAPKGEMINEELKNDLYKDILDLLDIKYKELNPKIAALIIRNIFNSVNSQGYLSGGQNKLNRSKIKPNTTPGKLEGDFYKEILDLLDFKYKDINLEDAAEVLKNIFNSVNAEASRQNLKERIAEVLNKINEELCPAGKAYIKRRKAAGEKSSAYLSGRAVKVCKGLMSGKKKKK